MKINKSNKGQQIIAAAVMGMNIVNSLSPLALTVKADVPASYAKVDLKPLEYSALPIAMQAAENLLFAKAEAQPIIVDSGITTSVSNISSGENMSVLNGGSGLARGLYGSQSIFSGGYGSAETVADGGVQIVSSGGSGDINLGRDNGTQIIYGKGSGKALNSGGTQIVTGDGGSGKVWHINNGGKQIISDGGFGSAEVINGFPGSGGEQVINGGSGRAGDVYGTQIINSGYGSASNINKQGSQIINGGQGAVSNINSSGTQIVNGGNGTVSKINDGGTQIVNKGNGRVDDIYNGGTQIINGGYGSVWYINSGGVQIINSGIGAAQSIVNGGTQIVSSGYVSAAYVKGGTQIIYDGIVSGTYIENNGTQVVNGGTGQSFEIKNNGTQLINGGLGSVGSLKNGGIQIINNGGTGSANHIFSGATQTVENGYGYAGWIRNGGEQIVNNGSGFAFAADGGTQVVNNEGKGYIVATSFNNGTQIINSGGSGFIGSGFLSNSSIQIINDGAYGFVDSLYSDGTQEIKSGGSGVVNYIHIWGEQIVREGAYGTAFYISDAGKQIVKGGTGYATNLTDPYGGEQRIEAGYGEVETIAGKGHQDIYGGTGVVKNLSKAIVSGNTYMGLQNVRGGTAMDTVINGGAQIIESGAAYNTTLNEGVISYRNPDAKVSGVNMNGGVYTLGADAGKYTIDGKFNFNGGTFDMAKRVYGLDYYQKFEDIFTQTHTYEQVKIADFEGSGGNFIFNTDLVTDTDGDKITISNSAEGTTAYVQISDESKFNNTTVTGNHALLLIKDTTGNATFIGKELNEGGLFTIIPTVENGLAIGKAENEWYLTHIVKKINNDTQVLVESTDNAYAMWRNTNDSLRSRLGELHMLPKNHDTDGAWVRYIGGEYEGLGFESNYNLYQLGYDKIYNNKSIYGFALEKGGGNATYEFGSSEDDLFTASLYGTWLSDDGGYTDIVAKIGNFDTKINSYGDFPDNADYSHNAYSLSIEYGKQIQLNDHGTYIEPQVQFIAGRLDGADYVTERGTKIQIDGINSYIGRLGLMLGHHTPDGNDVYVKANILHEFGGEGKLSMMAANGEILDMEKDYSDTWFELAVGTNIKIGHNSYFYGDIARGFSGDIDKKWQINAGFRFEF